jgi:hypothetical protein
MKLPLAMWFLDPVDPIKLNIPDYPVIVKQPMDFGTIKSNLESGVYESPDAFAEHVRLVFRNAIAYNQLRDNPVHIAARELSSRFEDRFRMLMTNYLSSISATAAASAPEPKASRGSTGGGKKSGMSKSASSSKGFAPAPKGRPSTAGPRPVESYLPPVVDSNLQTMLEMQRRMEEMANELKTLRTQVMQSEVKSSLEMQRFVLPLLKSCSKYQSREMGFPLFIYLFI